MPKNSKILTIDDLYNFCLKEGLAHFSAEDYGTSLRVQVPGFFSKLESDEYTLYSDIKILHTGRNRNKSNLKQKAANHIMQTLAYKPLLANFTNVNGEWDFTSHDFTITKDEEGNDVYEYQEKQIGCFTADKPYMEYDKEYEHDYMYGRVAIPREYTKAADIIERKNGTKVSVELDILEMSFDAKNRELSLDDAIATGCTCLGVDPETGEEIGEGMVDAHISLESFSAKNNGVFTTELLDELRKFNSKLETLKNSKEGGKDIVNKKLFEELLAKYEVSEDQVEFEYENLSDEELESKFAEVFGEDDDEPTPSDDGDGEPENEPEEPENDDDSDDSSDDDSDNSDNSDNADQYSLTLPDGTVKIFSLSLDDINATMFQLVNDTYSEMDNEIYSCIVYPDESRVVMCGWFSGVSYRQSYKRRKDNFSLEGDRVSVHSIFVTDDEEKVLNDAKANFEEASAKLAKYEAEPDKLALFESDEWSIIKDTEAFAELSKRENYFDLTEDEITEKLNEIVLEFAKNPENANFAVTGKKNDDEVEPKKSKYSFKPLIPSMNSNGRKSRYGNLFSKKD